MLIHRVNGADLVKPATVQLKDETSGFDTAANLAEAAMIRVFVDDPEGALSFPGHKLWTVREDDAPAGNQNIWAGYVGPKSYSRVGGGRAYKTGTGRVWDITLVEGNTYLLRKILRRETSTTNRPRETASARIAWWLTTPGMSGVVVDDGLVQASSVVMDEHDYHGQNHAEVLRDICLQTGFNGYIRFREATEDWQLILLDFRASGLDTSSLVVSDVQAEVDAAPTTTFYPNPDAAIHEIPDRIAAGILQAYDGGEVYLFDSDTADEFADIDLVASTATVKTASAATTLTTRELEEHSTEEEKVDGHFILVPFGSVNIVRAGQLISAKYVHGRNGWADGRYARVTRKVVRRPENLTQRKYLLDLDLVPAEPAFPEASEAYAHSPTDRAYTGARGAFRIFWASDHPGCDPGSPFATGNLSLVLTSGDVTGFQADGSGTLTVHSHGTMAGASAGTFTFTASVRVNGVAVLSDSVDIDNSGGIGPLNFTWDIDGSFHVDAGDIVETWFDVAGDRDPSIMVVPAGAGDCANYFDATGDLAA